MTKKFCVTPVVIKMLIHYQLSLVTLILVCVLCRCSFLRQELVMNGDNFIECGRRRCDRFTQYCDQVVRDCGICSVDCDPKRISGNYNANRTCHVNCPYFMNSLKAPTVLTTVSPSPTIDYIKEIYSLVYLILIVLIIGVSCLLIILLCYLINKVSSYHSRLQLHNQMRHFSVQESVNPRNSSSPLLNQPQQEFQENPVKDV